MNYEIKDTSSNNKQNKADKFIEDVDYYFENGYLVLTEVFLKKRGYCCSNGCRHCPYPKTEESHNK